MVDHTFDPESGGLQRVEVITGVGRRRRWATEAKAAIVAESYAGGASVSEVARRHGMRPQQLFGWRRQARSGAVQAGLPPFVPVVADGRCAGGALPATAMVAPAIEIEVRGIIVRVRGRVAADALAEVLAAVKRVP